MNWLWKLIEALLGGNPTPPPTPDPVPDPDPTPTPDPDPDPEPEPDPDPDEIRVPRGYFALQPGDVGRPLDIDVLKLPGVGGETIRIRWHEIQSSLNVLKWEWLDQQIDRCHTLGLPYKILIMTGFGGVPSWAYKDQVPWDESLIQNYCNFVGVLGKRYNKDQLCVGVHITGPTIASAEMHAKSGGEDLTKLPGYTPQKMIDAWKACIDAYEKAFPNVVSILSISGQNGTADYVLPVIDYAKRRLGARAAFQHNSLAAKTTVTASHHRIVEDLGKQGYVIGYEMVCPTSNATRFGSRKLIDGLAHESKYTYYRDIYPGDCIQIPVYMYELLPFQKA